LNQIQPGGDGELELTLPNGKTAEVVMKKILAGKKIPNPSLYGEDLVRFFEQQAADLREKYS